MLIRNDVIARKYPGSKKGEEDRELYVKKNLVSPKVKFDNFLK